MDAAVSPLPPRVFFSIFFLLWKKLRHGVFPCETHPSQPVWQAFLFERRKGRWGACMGLDLRTSMSRLRYGNCSCINIFGKGLRSMVKLLTYDACDCLLVCENQPRPQGPPREKLPTNDPGTGWTVARCDWFDCFNSILASDWFFALFAGITFVGSLSRGGPWGRGCAKKDGFSACCSAAQSTEQADNPPVFAGYSIMLL